MRIVLLLLLLASCSSKINIEEIKKKNNLCYYNDELYSGEVYSLFEGTNTVSYVAQIKKGIPNGSWIAYGYDGEIVSRGSFSVLNTINYEEEYIRITLEKIKEGDIEMSKVLVVTNFPKESKINPLVLKAVDRLFYIENLPKDTEVAFVEYEF